MEVQVPTPGTGGGRMSLTSRIALAVASLGAGYCLYLLLGFLRVIADNRLPWEHSLRFTREHYLAVGEAYSRGFAVGFFLCFFLAIVAFLIGTWYEKTVVGKRMAKRSLAAAE